MRLGYRAAYVALRVSALVVRPRTRGVKCLLLDHAGRALFVRHTYGDRRQWELPGGGVRSGETLDEAVRREAWEELGADLASWTEVACVRGDWYAKVEELTVFRASWPRFTRVRIDPVEIASYAWFPLEGPPSPLGPTTEAALRALG